MVFATQTCLECPSRVDCTQSKTSGRVLHLRPQAAHARAGIEGTLSQGVRSMGLRRARYDGLPKVHFQQVLTAVAINLVRIDAVLTGTRRGKTRRSPFARLVSPSDQQDAVGA